MNGFAKTALLMAGMTALFMGVGALVGGRGGALIAFAFAAATNAFAYWNSDRMVLRHYGARPADDAEAPALAGLVRQLAGNAGIPTPALYIIDNPQPNAFATGRDPAHAAVAVSTGLIRRLSMPEVAGVIAHELAHIKNRDTLTMTVTATLAGAIGMLGNMAFFMGARDGEGRRHPLAGLAVMILAPVAAMLVQMGVSRAREYEADRIGAQISGRPEWLADALEKIAGEAAHVPNDAAEANPATAHMFIINPLHGAGIDSLFSTHPKTQERVNRLRAMAADKAAHG